MFSKTILAILEYKNSTSRGNFCNTSISTMLFFKVVFHKMIPFRMAPMKTKLLLTSIIFLSFVFFCNKDLQARQNAGQHKVRPHVRKNGQYVRPYSKTNPRDGIPRDNWSSRGNTNPHTGKPGNKNPYE